MRFFIKIYGLFLVLILSYWAIKPLFIPGFFPMHDDTQVSRVFEMGKVLQEGIFPVRWVPDLGYGYGYPIFNFYAPLAYYIGGFLTLFGIDALIATKLTMGIGILFAGVTMYLFAREYWGEAGGSVAAIFYQFAPFHAVDIYVRGDMAEFFAYAFIPLTFFGLLKINKNPQWLSVVLFSCTFTLLVLSHNLTALMTTPFLLAYTMILLFSSPRNTVKTKLVQFSISFFLGILLSAFYWIPVFFEMRYTNVLSQLGGGAHYADHFVCIMQFWDTPWGFGGSIPGCIDGFSFQMGKLHIVGVFLSALFVILLKRAMYTKIVVVSIAGFCINTFLMLKTSRPLWEAFPLMAFFQYPWRFLLFTSFSSSFLIGFIWFAVLFYLPKVFKNIISFLAIILSISGVLFYQEYFNPQTIYPRPSSLYISNDALHWNISKVSDEYMPRDFQKPKNINEVANSPLVLEENISFMKSNITSHHMEFTLEGKKEVDLHLNIAYFPSWKIYIDNKEIPISINTKGMSVVFPKGIHTLSVRFVQTHIEKIANGLTVIGMGILITGIIVLNKKKTYS